MKGFLQHLAVALQVFDVGNEALVPEAQLNQYPSTEADITVEVILRPKIDVYPASTTLVKSQVITSAFATLEGRTTASAGLRALDLRPRSQKPH